jgi:diguanylate cyclase (GGDEF)-like protein
MMRPGMEQAGEPVMRRRPVPLAAPEPRFLDLRLRWRMGHAALAAAGLMALVALFRPLGPSAPTRLRAAVIAFIGAGLVVSGLLASLKGRRRAEALAFYAFVLLAADGLGQMVAPLGWPAWPLPVLLLAVLAVLEPLPVGLGAAAFLAALTAAQAAAGGFRDWKPAVAQSLGGAALVLVLDRALAGEKRRLSSTLAALARVEHGIDHLEDQGRPVSALGLSELSPEARRHRRLQSATELEERLARLVHLARAALPAHAVLYFDLDREREQAFLRAADGPPALVPGATSPLSADPFAFVVARQQRFYVTDYKRLLWSLPWYQGEVRVGTLLALPVATADVVTGVLVAERLETQSFTAREPELLEAVAELAADITRSARAAVGREETGQEFKAVYRVSGELATAREAARVRQLLLACVHDLVPVEAAAVVTADDPPTRYVVHDACGWAADYHGRQVSLEEKTWAAWTVRSAEEPLLLDDLGGAAERMPVLVLDEGGARADSLLALPLRAGARTLGALLLMGARGAFGSDTARVMGILANQAAAALQTTLLIAQSQEQALRDRLTSLLNRGAFDEELKKALSRAERRSEQVALLLLDLDHFKKLNDTYGHPAGDAALRHLAGVLGRSLRQGDQAARIGGEEFAVILPGIDDQGARLLAERLRAAIEQARLVFGGARLSLTASLGLAVWPRHAQEPAALVQAADRALYVAKQAGRNRVCVSAD